MKKLVGLVTLIALLLTSIVYGVGNNFADVKVEDWYYEALDEVVGRGIIVGYPDNTFKPGNNISRAEFTKTIRTSLELDIVEGNSFVDTVAHWAKDEINTAVENFIIDKSDYGYTFEPNKNITRIEMAIMVVRALGLNDEAVERAREVTSFLDDSSIEDADKGYVVIATEKGIISGYTDRTFKPNGNATRAEAAQMLLKMLTVIEKENDNVVDRVNEALQERNVDTVLPKGTESSAVNQDPQTYEELIENIESLKVYSYTTRKSNDWELIALSQFVSNPNEDQVTANVIGAIRMELPKYKLEVVDFNFEGTVYNCIYSDELVSDGFTSGVLIKDGEILERISHVKDHYILGLKDKGNIYKADYIAFTRYADDFFTSSSKYDSSMRKMLIVFENPFK